MSVGTAGAIIGASIIGGTSLAGGLIGAHGAHSAADKQSAAAEKVSQLAQDSAGTAATGVNDATTAANEKLAGLPESVRKELAPYLDLGSTSAGGLKEFLGSGALDKQFAFNPGDLTKTPGYQFTLKQGMEALSRAASSQGKSLGGGTLKSLANYSQGLASTTYGQEFQRSLDTFNTNKSATALKLSGLLDSTRIGQGSATDLGNVESATTFGQANNTLNAARYAGDAKLQAARISGDAISSGAAAQAAGDVGAANSWSSALGGVGNAANGLLTYGSLLKGSPTLQTGGYAPSYYDLTGTGTYQGPGQTPLPAPPPVTYAPRR